MTRRGNPNYIAAACGAAAVLSYLFLPLFNAGVPLIGGLALNGWAIIGYVPLAILPLLLLIGIVIASLLVEERAAAIYDGVVAAIILLVMLAARGMIASSLAQALAEGSSEFRDIAAGLLRYGFRVGAGLIVCLIAAAAACVLEILLNNRKPAPPPTPDPWY